jgi:hypothetical protein
MVVHFSLDMRNRRVDIFKLARNQEGFSQTILARPLLQCKGNGENSTQGNTRSDTSTLTNREGGRHDRVQIWILHWR